MRKKLILHGNLTDGGVKYVAQRYAMELHLTGISARGPEGTIEIEVQGEEQTINKFIEKIKQGNQFFIVQKVDESVIPEIPEKIFHIG